MVLVLVPYTPRSLMPKLADGYVDSYGRTVALANIAEYQGGDPANCPATFWPGQVPEHDVWACAPNHFDRVAFIEWLRGVWPATGWSNVTIAVCGSEDICFEVHTLDFPWGDR